MKSFQAFRLDTANQCLWRGEERVSIPPKPYDMLRYLVENPGRLITQEEFLEKLWPKTYVNPELIRKYILDIRKILGDRPDKPEFIETVTKRGYRFIASVVDEGATTPINPTAIEEEIRMETTPSRPESSPRKRSLWKLVLTPVLAVVVVTAIGRQLRVARTERPVPSSNDTSIAVLPFADMSPGKDQEYFSDGLAEQLIHELAKVSGLKVVGRSSAFQFQDKNEDLRDVGRKLGVANVLEGSVRREGNHVRITAELIKADDGFQLWSQTYDREIKDIFAVQDEIARSTTQVLRLKLLGGSGQPIPSSSQNPNSDAYQAYLQAKYFIGRGRGKEDLEKALAYADTAIKFDERYAPAWALRASVHNAMAEAELSDDMQQYREARNDAERAIVLDFNCASAYLALAENQLDHDWDWDAAKGFVTRAEVIEPGSTEVLRVSSNLFWVLGDLDQAIKLREQLVALDPLRADSFIDRAFLLYLAGRYKEALADLQKALDLNPHAAFANFTLGLIFLAEGMPRQALAAAEKEQSDWAKLTLQASADHALGRERDSNAALTQLVAKHAADAAFQVAEVYAFRGESDKAFQWLERAYEQRDAGLTMIKTDPLLKTLRRDARYGEFVKKMHLPS
jgi:TolB-like protein/DNA-binding winged helix-turn-helix (wHTH) protein/Tfp pilus assembly protein PilF